MCEFWYCSVLRGLLSEVIVDSWYLCNKSSSWIEPSLHSTNLLQYEKSGTLAAALNIPNDMLLFTVLHSSGVNSDKK
jgi:hypothetical protein